MEKKNIVFFDGVCNMCNGFIDFLIRRDKKKIIYYSSLQSDFAKNTLKDYNIVYDETGLTTIYFFSDDKLYSQSTAILKILSLLKQPYPFISKVALLFKMSWRDKIYKCIAKNRYKIFGKRNTCRMPSKEEKAMFLN